MSGRKKNPPAATVADQIGDAVADWIRYQAPRVRDLDVVSSIKFTIMNPGGDDLGELALELRIEETSERRFTEADEPLLTVPGLRFDTR